MHTATYSCSPLPTTAPSPPSTDPTADTDETHPPTIQDSQRPTDTPPIITSPNDNGDEIKTFDMLTSTIPTTEPANSNRTTFPVAIAAGVIAFLVLIIIVTITLIVSLAVCVKARKINRATVSVVSNEAYGVTLQDMATHTEESTYTYAAVGQADITEAKWNEAYATNIITEGNEAYATNFVTQGNEAYKAVTSVTVSETVDLYDYVKS